MHTQHSLSNTTYQWPFKVNHTCQFRVRANDRNHKIPPFLIFLFLSRKIIFKHFINKNQLSWLVVELRAFSALWDLVSQQYHYFLQRNLNDWVQHPDFSTRGFWLSSVQNGKFNLNTGEIHSIPFGKAFSRQQITAISSQWSQRAYILFCGSGTLKVMSTSKYILNYFKSSM